MDDQQPSTPEFAAASEAKEVTIDAEKAVGELVLEGAEAAAVEANPETLAEEQAEVATEIKEDVEALPVEAPVLVTVPSEQTTTTTPGTTTFSTVTTPSTTTRPEVTTTTTVPATTTTLPPKLPVELPTTPNFPDNEPGDPGENPNGPTAA